MGPSVGTTPFVECRIFFPTSPFIPFLTREPQETQPTKSGLFPQPLKPRPLVSRSWSRTTKRPRTCSSWRRERDRTYGSHPGREVSVGQNSRTERRKGENFRSPRPQPIVVQLPHTVKWSRPPLARELDRGRRLSGHRREQSEVDSTSTESPELKLNLPTKLSL